MILLIDNYDRFVHNLGRYLRRLGQETVVVRNDEITVDEIRAQQPQAIVLSPGPCAPQQAGCCLDVGTDLHATVPILGVCLGHQVIAEAFGGTIERAKEPVHGRASRLEHTGQGTFANLPESFLVGRYHSLVVGNERIPDCLNITASLPDGTIMAIEHEAFPVVGWQFHPESVLTQHGYQLLGAFLRRAGITSNDAHSSKFAELKRAIPEQPDWYKRAVEYPGHHTDRQATATEPQRTVPPKPHNK